MKKILSVLTFLAVLFCGINEVSAQGSAFPNGTLGINLGFGCGNSDWGGYGYNNHHNRFFVPTFNAAVDYAFLGNVINSHGSISGGGYFGIGCGHEKWEGNKNKDFRFRLGTRGALHYTWVNNLDTYAGIALGFRQDTYKYFEPDGTEHKWGPFGDFDCFGFAGVRYIMGSFAFYSELQTTNFSIFQIGISFVF